MNKDDFRCMRRGKITADLSAEDSKRLLPVNQCQGGKRTALLLLHGFSSTPAVFRQFLNTFTAAYDAVIIPALPGHVLSIEAFATMRATELLSFVEQSCQELIGEYEQVDVMGLSMGGLLATYLANRFTLHHLYLLAPALDLHLNISKTLLLTRFCRWLGFKRIRSAAGNLCKSEAYEIAYRQLPLTTIIELLTLIQQFKFTKPTCPTDLFLGAHDEVVNSHTIANRFAECPSVTIHWLTNSAHVLPLDNDSQQIIDCVLQNQKRGKRSL